MLGELGMKPDHLFHRFAYMKNDIPVAGCAHQAGTCRFGTDPATSVLDADCRAHELDNLYVVGHERLPEHRRGEPGADGDGERAARRRPPARAPRVTAAVRPPSGEQLELVHGDQRAVVVEVGGGLRTYSVGDRDVLDGYASDELCRPDAARCSSPGRTGSRTAAYEFDGRRPPAAADRARARATRSTGSSAGTPGRCAERDGRAGRPGPRARTRSPAIRSRWTSESSTRSPPPGCRCGRRATNLGPDACPYGAGEPPVPARRRRAVDSA